MPIVVRPATVTDLPDIVALLLGIALRRNAANPEIWPLADNASDRVLDVVQAGIDGTDGAPKELWHVAEASGQVVGVSRAMMLPIPPIYAGLLGLPGLILDDFAVADVAEPNTGQALLQATETALIKAGAGFFLVSSVACDTPRRELYTLGYAPITLYVAKTGLTRTETPTDVRPAALKDVPEIVTSSAKHRAKLAEISAFWIPHSEADSRFWDWMEYSLTLADRDMMVVDHPNGQLGYIIAQAIADFLIPMGHSRENLGVLDDFYDDDFAKITGELTETPNAEALLSAAENALAKRGYQTTFVVCPAGWPSKRSMLERHGYSIAKTWHIKAEGL